MTLRPSRPRLAAVLGAGALALTACAPSSSDGDSAGGDGSTTLTVWSWRVEDKAAYEKIFDVYEQEHEGVTVDFKPFTATEYNKILATGLAGSDGPDVPQVRSYGGLEPTIASGALAPLDDAVDLSSWDQNIVAGAKGKEDGTLYSVPLARQATVMFYDKTLFADAGVEVPTTWQEFVDACKTFAAAGTTPLAVGAKDDWTLPIVHEILAGARFGGNDFQEAVQAGDTDFTDPDFVASLQVLADLEQYMPKSVTGVAVTDAQTIFTSGKAAMYPGGSFDLATLQSAAPDMDLGVFQVPPPPGSPSGATTAGWADGNFAVNANSPHQEEATELVAWMATPEFGQMVADEIKQISAVPGVSYSDPVLQDMADDLDDSGSAYLLLTDFRYGSPSGTDLLGKGIQELFLGSKDAEAVSADLNTGVMSWFTPGG
ncbi:extracellular solute-binding protein [Phycicoccus endophyticus]|uniref:Extracellular solute-binding protein n=1 Tax=Phycicoccus endophyticus TaxID=1690220 RepID=A0A7G9R039_9MICO|nr:extracellular solute-binding protein [Phycicoccus endophyticus]QNN48964.1 extracellular solute-binding protein [Phycicoccus endophyticus]GGL45725.1 ABC transporter substrate-binding protein [Phycicoccus endophyticus]